jgi:hypothetical protein
VTERLYTARDVAKILGVRPSAVSNRRNRGSTSIPDPAFVYGVSDAPLWTRAQIETIVAERVAAMEKVLR